MSFVTTNSINVLLITLYTQFQTSTIHRSAAARAAIAERRRSWARKSKVAEQLACSSGNTMSREAGLAKSKVAEQLACSSGNTMSAKLGSQSRKS